MAKAIIKTTFQLFCKEHGGSWTPQGTWDEVDNFEAMSAAHDADAGGQWEAVRLMSVKTYRDGKPPQETIAWMSPHLTRGGAAPKRGGAPTGETQPIAGRPGKADGAPAAPGGRPAPTPAAADAGGGGGGRRDRKKRDRKDDLVVARAGDAYRKIVEQQLGRGAAKQGAGNGEITEAEREHAVNTTAVMFRLFTVLIIDCLAAYAMTIPVGIVVKGMVKSGANIPGFIAGNASTAGFLVAFILGWLLLGKMLLKPGDMSTAMGLIRSKGEGDEDDEDDKPKGRGLGLHAWRDSGDDDEDDEFEDEVHFQDQPSADFGGAGGASSAAADDGDLDYSPEAAPADSRKGMTDFLKAALTAIKDRLSKLDKVGKFGLNLFIAGAADAMANAQGLDAAARNGLISEAVVAIGTKKKMAGKFCDNFAGYERDAKSKALVDAGRSAMQRFMKGDGAAFDSLAATIDGFANSRPAKTAGGGGGGVAVILTTELLGRGEIAQQFGDAALHELMDAHASVVRNALGTYHGRELDSTGETVTAAFTSPANAVGAAMVAQQEFARRSAAAGAMPIKVRMALNAGPATDETDSAFRAAKQVAVGICRQAGAERIYLTQPVRELLGDQTVKLREVGAVNAGGSSGAITVHEVIWSSHLAVS